MVSKQKNQQRTIVSQTRNIDPKLYIRLGFTLFTILVLVLVWTTFSTYNVHHEEVSMWSFAAKYHVLIMGIAFSISMLYGFFISRTLYHRLEAAKKGTQNMLSLVLKFLSEDEKKIIEHLVEEEGKTTQAEISRLQGMTRLKAHRSLQKLSQRKLITITPHGKIRKIKLREDLFETLTQQK